MEETVRQVDTFPEVFGETDVLFMIAPIGTPVDCWAIEDGLLYEVAGAVVFVRNTNELFG